jgi:hypothetical protein
MDRAERVIHVIAVMLNGGEPTVFALEAACRHGLRRGLILTGCSWTAADKIAAWVVRRALHELNAVRPTWIQGQPEYLQDGVVVFERTRCLHCGWRLPEGHFKFCSDRCNSAFRQAVFGEDRREERAATRIAGREAFRAQAALRVCERCTLEYRPNYSKQRFCSVICAAKRTTAEKLNGKAHPWQKRKIGAVGANGAARSSPTTPIHANGSADVDAKMPNTTPSLDASAPRPALG